MSEPEKLLTEIVGKTIESVIHENLDDADSDRDRITLCFTDGTSAKFESADTSGYCSWIVVTT